MNSIINIYGAKVDKVDDLIQTVFSQLTNEDFVCFILRLKRRVVVLYVIIPLRDFILQCGIKRDKAYLISRFIPLDPAFLSRFIPLNPALSRFVPLNPALSRIFNPALSRIFNLALSRIYPALSRLIKQLMNS